MNRPSKPPILVVDDDEASRKLLESMLAAEGKAGSGHAVRTASDYLSEARFMLIGFHPPPPRKRPIHAIGGLITPLRLRLRTSPFDETQDRVFARASRR